MYRTLEEVIRSKSYIIQVVFSMLINFGINFGLEYATMTNWGKRKDRTTPCDPDHATHRENNDRWDCASLEVWTWNHYVNSCIAFDWVMTCFFLGFFCAFFGTGGAEKEVDKKVSETVDDAVLLNGFLKYTPVAVVGQCKRSFYIALQNLLLFCVPVLAIMSVALPPGHSWGVWQYVTFKGVMTFFMAFPVYTLAHLSGIRHSHHARREREALLASGHYVSDKPSAPLVGQVGLV
jgi:hypothetical protein